MKKSTLTNIGIVSIIMGFIGVLVISPVIVFGFAYLGGWILKIFVGSIVANGLNLLFGTARFTPDSIPMICAVLATIGKYFKSTQTNNNKK